MSISEYRHSILERKRMQDDRHTIACGAPIDTANWACLAGSMYPVHLSSGISQD
ncbi:hypothetical protein PHLCEN_2v7078 [Hermanssonia centrifuga]|uniref:Uncharacterized protein n=1 Tax=Hermanssonia centrifuga TaxID=98765 RepID=A0A2R6NY76_9APHY|nr:hypothetical protein PHLCEN_2v7078 [Hermanssonia centrifuga]